MKPIYLGADHAGFDLKEKIKSWLKKKRISFVDCGNLVFDKDDDYPDFAERVAKAVVKSKSLGILICGSGQGMCITANKIRGAQAVIPFSKEEARLSRRHNNANILCLSGRYIGFPKASIITDTFLQTKFIPIARHVRRLKKIAQIEKHS